MITAEDIRKRHVKLRYEGSWDFAYTIFSALEKKGFRSGKISHTFNNITCVGEVIYFFEGKEFGSKCPSESELRNALNSIAFRGSYTIREGKEENSRELKGKLFKILCEDQMS